MGFTVVTGVVVTDLDVTEEEPGVDPLHWSLFEFDLSADGPVQVRAGAATPAAPGTPLVSVGVLRADSDVAEVAGLRYITHEADGPELRITQRDAESGLVVTSRLSTVGEGVRGVTEIRNEGTEPRVLGSVSSLQFVVPGTGAGDGADEAAGARRARNLYGVRILSAYNSWCQEFRWQLATAEQAGFVDAGIRLPNQVHAATLHHSETGSHSAERRLPIGGIADIAAGTAWLWSVESNAAWRYSITDVGAGFAVSAGGPSYDDGEWILTLPPGGSWTSRAASVVASTGGIDGAFGALTSVRRGIRRPNTDNARLPVIFNDYMNCLVGDPTTAKLRPLIDAAASVGSEYFVIDAGWYSDDSGWWDTVGEWRESATRFPDGGLRGIVDRIRDRGMIPGLWIEPEVMGVNSPAVGELPPDAYFQRNGQPLEIRGRYQLDFRHPAVVRRLDAVIDRLVVDYGAGYFKFDYNITAEHGSSVPAGVSPGAAMLDHNRAYAAWVAGIFERHPDLVIENCSSGGTRADYDQLSRMSLLSTSDQEHPLHYVPIAAAAPTAVTPEQGAVWAYPQPSYTAELNALCLVNAMLGRIHLSGRIDEMDGEQLAGVRTAIATYKGIRPLLARGVPRWPLGLPGWYDDWTALAIVDGGQALLSVWRRGGHETVELALPWLVGREISVGVGYPQHLPTRHSWDREAGILAVTLPAVPSARLLRVGLAAA